MRDPWAMLNAGLWLVFAAWAIAIHLCTEEPREPDQV